MSKVVEAWDEKAKYDIDTARAMLESKRYVYVLFCCQQAAEKALKAEIVRNTAEFPPRIHNLVKLCEEAKIEVDDELDRMMKRLSSFYVQSRYPEQMSGPEFSISRTDASEVLKKTEEFVEWLLSRRK